MPIEEFPAAQIGYLENNSLNTSFQPIYTEQGQLFSDARHCDAKVGHPTMTTSWLLVTRLQTAEFVVGLIKPPFPKS